MRPPCLFLLALLLAAGCGNRLERLRRDLGSGDAEVVIAALAELGKARDTVAVPFIVELLEDDERDVRRKAAAALGAIGDERAVDPLADRLAAEDDEKMVGVLFRALGRLGRASEDRLIELADSRRPELRAGACIALGEVRAVRALDLLIRRLDDPDRAVRAAAVRALRAIGDSRGMDAIAGQVGGADVTGRDEAGEVFGGEGYRSEMDRVKSIIRRYPGR